MISVLFTCVACLLIPPPDGPLSPPDYIAGPPPIPKSEVTKVDPLKNRLPAARYHGTLVGTNPDLDVDEKVQQRIAKILTDADWIPQDRLNYFSIYDNPDLVCTHWLVGIMDIKKTGGATVVTLWASPQMTWSGGSGLVRVSDQFIETYIVTSRGIKYLNGKGNGSKLRGMVTQY